MRCWKLVNRRSPQSLRRDNLRFSVQSNKPLLLEISLPNVSSVSKDNSSDIDSKVKSNQDDFIDAKNKNDKNVSKLIL